MFKKSRGLLATSVATFLLGLGMATQAHATVVQLTPSNVQQSLGETVNFDLTVSDVTDLYGFQFSLAFDPSLVNITGLVEGPALDTVGETFFAPGAFDNAAGFLELTGDTLISDLSGFSGSGVLASISFKTIGEGLASIALNDLFLLNSSLSEITATSGSASINVRSATTVPEPPAYALLLIALPLMVWSRQRKLPNIQASHFPTGCC